MYPKGINNLVESFKYFPGIGEKTAERLAFSLLSMDEEQIDFLKGSIDKIKNIKRCKICNSFSEDDICDICKDNDREQGILCVVEDPKSIYTIEKLGVFKGKYHVLNGLITSIDAMDPDKIKLSTLIDRIKKENIKEIILAVKPCIEGEMTSLYIKNILSKEDVLVSRIAQGIPIGADIEYIDALTFEQAFDNRKNL